MERLKSSLSLLLMLLIAGWLVAQANDNVPVGSMDLPVASIDDVFIPLVNPSLLGTGNANGIGIAHLQYDNTWQKHYWLFFNSDFLSYVYERDNGTNIHTIASGDELLPVNIFPNAYLGSNYSWVGKDFKYGNIRHSVSYRPFDFSSLAFTWDNPYKSPPSYRWGAAIRPLAFVSSIKEYRLELSADFNYAKNYTDPEKKYKVFKPIIGANTQILDGIQIGGSYNLETESAMLNFSLSGANTSLGTINSKVKDEKSSTIAYAHMNNLNYLPFLGKKPRTWYDMKLTGSIISYKAPKYTFGPFKIYDSKEKSVEDVIAKINKAKDDPAVKGIFLRNPYFGTSYALQQELITTFNKFKTSGKSIAFYYDNISNAGYAFAAAIADKIYLNPNGSVDLRGLAINAPYLKNMLTALGIETYNFRSHKYKNAGNMLSESEMTEAEREVYDSILQSLYNQMVARIDNGRGNKLSKPVTDIIDAGPYFKATDALSNGLVDALVYEDQLEKTMKDDFNFAKQTKTLPDYRSYDWSQPKEHQIAVIYASGSIVMGTGTPGQKIAHESTVKLIKAARKNKAYKGIILRVDSGGGSAQASDIILRELELAQTENKKPVVVSMAGVAGSGGYYIACKADKIVANPATITGSIGVIGLVINPTEMFRKIRVNWSTVKKGANSDFGSMYRPWTEEEKQRLTDYIEYTYEDFVKKVDTGRKNLTLDQVHQYAQGRIWTGEQAKEIGLIDELGGLDVALKAMHDLTGIKGKLRLVDATSSETGIRLDMSSNPLLSLTPYRALEMISSDYIELYELWEDFAGEKALMLSPEMPSEVQF